MLQAEGTVNVRTRDNVVLGMRPIDTTPVDITPCVAWKFQRLVCIVLLSAHLTLLFLR